MIGMLVNGEKEKWQVNEKEKRGADNRARYMRQPAWKAGRRDRRQW